jgi:hypothetical protein
LLVAVAEEQLQLPDLPLLLQDNQQPDLQLLVLVIKQEVIASMEEV